jgi:hypothetical protein
MPARGGSSRPGCISRYESRRRADVVYESDVDFEDEEEESGFDEPDLAEEVSFFESEPVDPSELPAAAFFFP